MNQFNPTISVFKSLFKTKETPFNLSLLEVYERIKNGSKQTVEIIEKIRSSSNKEEINELKKQLPAILFNGTFSHRNDNSLIEHSGLCVFDFDHYTSIIELVKARNILIKDKYTLMVFISPSGYGLKVLVRIPKSNKDEHTRRFKAYKNYINIDNFDDSCGNVSRVCFESYDPEIFYNPNAEIFKDIKEDKGFKFIEKEPTIVLDNEQKKIDLILKFNWQRKYVQGQRNDFIFDLAGAFCEYGIDEETTFNYIFNNIVNDDMSEAEVKSAVRSAHKQRTFKSKYFEDYEKKNKVSNKLKNGITTEIIAKELNINASIVEEIKETLNDDAIFWTIKTDKSGKEHINIDPYKYACFLAKNGFLKYYPENSQEPTFVRVKENKVRISSVSQIKDFVLDYLLEKKIINVWNYCSKSPYLFTDKHLNMIDSINLLMLHDDKETSYIPFKNRVVKVTKQNTEVLQYIDAPGYIWENQIINREFKELDDYTNDFQDFVKKVSNNEEQRIFALESTIGYLLHTFKDKTDQKAIILNDQEIDDNPNGGSGKSLMLTALNNFRKVVKIDGKVFDPKKSDFVYQRVNLDTQILAFDDVKKNFNFEQLFSLITEGITVNRKNKDEIFIPFDRSPKIIITTNYVINGTGNSHERRRHEIEFFQYFNNNRNPLTEYGRLLFDSWSLEDWHKFDNYMIKNIQLFLNNGLSSTISINADAKRLISATTKDFYDWVNDDNLKVNTRIYNKDILEIFLDEYKNYRDLSIKTFLKWVAFYADFKGFDFIKEVDHKGRYFKLIDNTQPHDDSDALPF